MKKTIITLAVSSVLCVPFSVNAIEVAGKKLNIYGKIEVSIDYSDQDDPAVKNDGLSVSSNSSRLGFKGEIPLANGMDIIWQMEQSVRVDDGSKGTFANRNSYIGLVSGVHSLRVGKYNTPFKVVGSKWGVFGNSVGGRRALLGASYSDNNKLNTRPDNVVMYQIKNDSLMFQALYAVDPENKKTGSIDDNDRSVFSTGVWWKLDNITLSAGYSDWQKHSSMGDGTTLRVAAIVGFGSHKVGAIFEDINPDVTNSWDRSVYGVNWTWKFASNTDVRAQYIVADDAKNQADTGARKVALGLFHKLDKSAEVYLAYGATDNDKNASFQAVDGGHGDEVKTVDGGSPSSISVGLIYKF